ncbi:nuclear transport factor 2 family protein [Streptomyces sp. NPDC090445]|uniref:nuclear transport factor 2 family protein n=1 Tax=Streptomyces sp. NPDC090445 TaxID=3365963 RepID=UPI0038260A78
MTAQHDVNKVLRQYFDGLYHGDTDLLGRVFHPSAVYATATEGGGGGELLRLSMDEYFPVVRRREPPAARGEARRDRIVSVEFAGPVTALARVECSMGPRRYWDFLTLVQVEGRWQIVSKVFHFETVEDED